MKEVWNTAIYVTIVFVHVSCFIYFYEIYYLGSNKYVLLNNCGVVVSQRFIFFLTGNYLECEIAEELPGNTGDIMTLFEAKYQY